MKRFLLWLISVALGVVVLPPVELLSLGVVTVPGAGVEPPRQ